MNRYGLQMMKHYSLHRAAELAQLVEPEAYFETLGHTIELEVDRLAASIAGPSRPDEGFLTRAGRLSEARFSAESDVLRTYLAG